MAGVTVMKNTPALLSRRLQSPVIEMLIRIQTQCVYVLMATGHKTCLGKLATSFPFAPLVWVR